MKLYQQVSLNANLRAMTNLLRRLAVYVQIMVLVMLLSGVVVGGFLVALHFTPQPQPVEAAPLEGGYMNSCFSSSVITQTTNGPSIGNVGVYKSAEVYSDIDVTDEQTVTLKLQVSPDGTVWYDHPAGDLLSASADNTTLITTSMVTYGKYNRCVATIEGEGAGITGTLKVLYRDDRSVADNK
jgi:hypothetical protein